MAEGEAKRRGRPSIPEEERKSGNLTFRTRGSLRAQLETAAQESGRSVSEEIEHRMQLSFDRKAVALQIYGDSNTALMKALYSILGATTSDLKHSNSAVHLAAITTILAAAGSRFEDLIEKNPDPSVWAFLSRTGVMQALGLNAEEATKEAERVVPEMAAQMAEYRAGAEMARRLKQEKPK
ncbi:hypothetical protein [Methylobacterium sp. J-090]|uniref:hypothetical protein n=1 Tax=Methylobacterium sp. J-090 TaxID=2836666 RepID=UPI001FB8B26D|nr:hypothetical protein [Methylobacterium sp. J-090]MCJ2082772.1 hypothetical protein [Methylobacterium sp. J-090]